MYGCKCGLAEFTSISSLSFLCLNDYVCEKRRARAFRRIRNAMLAILHDAAHKYVRACGWRSLLWFYRLFSREQFQKHLFHELNSNFTIFDLDMFFHTEQNVLTSIITMPTWNSATRILDSPESHYCLQMSPTQRPWQNCTFSFTLNKTLCSLITPAHIHVYLLVSPATLIFTCVMACTTF